MRPGVVVVTKFCKSNSSKFRSYVDYINREEAVRLEHESKYNLYADYMGNSEKTTGLFTKQKDQLSKEEKDQLKEGFQMAQNNGSLMWQTVISFDNEWLAENGLYDSKSNQLDEKKLKEVTRNAINKMLEKENLENALWSGAIHFNTDNIHVHVATVEPVPMRATKTFIQYQMVEKDGIKVKEPIRKPNGEILTKEEYIGRFKGQSIGACKSTVVNQIMQEKEVNQNINKIIRESILQGTKDNPLMKDPVFRNKLLQLYQDLPDVDRKMWNYNSSIMKPYQKQIDELTTQYINTYHKEEFEQLKKDMKSQEEQYSRAYGGKENHYAENKMKDLYTRMGNSILKELRSYDRINKENIVNNQMVQHTSNQRMATRSGWLLANALRRLKKSMDKDWQQILNEREHDQLQEETQEQKEDYER